MSLLLCLYLSLQLALVVVEGPSRQLGASAPYAPDILQVAVWSLLLLLFATAEHRMNAHTKALNAHHGAPIAVQRGETNVPVAIYVWVNRSWPSHPEALTRSGYSLGSRRLSPAAFFFALGSFGVGFFSVFAASRFFSIFATLRFFGVGCSRGCGSGGGLDCRLCRDATLAEVASAYLHEIAG